MKTYLCGGNFDGNPLHGTSVIVREAGKPDRSLPPRPDLHDHSPRGFGWGYSGSRPAQLALAILADHFSWQTRLGDFWPDRGRTEGDHRALELYQDFKAEIIAALSRSAPFALTQFQIDTWVELAEHRQDIDIRR